MAPVLCGPFLRIADEIHIGLMYPDPPERGRSMQPDNDRRWGARAR